MLPINRRISEKREGTKREKERWRQVVAIPEIPVTEPKPFYWTRTRWEKCMDDAQCPGHSMISRMRLAVPSIFSISRHAEIIQLLNIRLFSNPDIRVRREYRVSNRFQLCTSARCMIRFECMNLIVNGYRSIKNDSVYDERKKRKRNEICSFEIKFGKFSNTREFDWFSTDCNWESNMYGNKQRKENCSWN